MNSEIDQRVVNEIFSASQAWENMQVLTDDIGSRLAGSLQVEHTLMPIGVCMAADGEFDPYRA